MKAHLALSTRISVAVLVSLALVTLAVTTVVLTKPKDALAHITAEPAVTSVPTPSATKADLSEMLNSLSAAADGTTIETNLAQLLPNHKFTMDGSVPRPLAAAVVIGTISSIEPLAAYSSSTGGIVDFDSQDVSVRVLSVTVVVDHEFGMVGSQTSIKMGLKVAGSVDAAALSSSLADGQRVVAVLDPAGSFSFDQSLMKVRRNSSLLGLVDVNGNISFPALGTDSASFVGQLKNVTDIISEAARTAPVGTVKNGEITSG